MTIYQSSPVGREPALLYQLLVEGGIEVITLIIRKVLEKGLAEARFVVEKVDECIMSGNWAAVFFVLAESHLVALISYSEKTKQATFTIDLYTCRGEHDGGEVIEACMDAFGQPMDMWDRPVYVSREVAPLHQISRIGNSLDQLTQSITATFYGVAEHFFDDGEKALNQFRSILSDDGFVVTSKIVVPFNPGYTLLVIAQDKETRQPSFLSIHTYREYESLVFTIEGERDGESPYKMLFTRAVKYFCPSDVQFALKGKGLFSRRRRIMRLVG